MKKAVSIFAVMVMTIGMFTSCEADNPIEETDALYDINVDAGVDGDSNDTTRRDG